MTNQELKNKILTEFYQTGRIDGYYFGKKSYSKSNPIRYFINSCLFKTNLLESSGLQFNDFVDDCYQTAFFELANMDADKFIEIYNKSEIKGSKLIACTLRIIILKCFSRDKRNNNPNHALVSKLGFASVFNASNYQIQAVETNNDDEDEPSLILFDTDEESDFVQEYGFTPEELISELTPEAQFVFYKVLGKQRPGAKSKIDLAERKELNDTIRGIRTTIEAKKGISNELRSSKKGL